MLSLASLLCKRFVLLVSLLLFTATARAELVGYWNFENNRADLITDRSGRNNNLQFGTTSTSRIQWNSGGKNGGCLYLNGNSTAKLVGNSNLTGLPLGNSPYTVSTWVKNLDGISTRGIVGWGTFASAANLCNAIRLDDSDANGLCGLRHYWWGADLISTGSQVTNASGASLSNGSWVHVATRYDGATRAIYVNGVLVASDVPGVNNVANVNFNIGQTWTGDGTFLGYLDDVAIWNTALPLSQIQALAANSITPLTGPKVTTFATNKTSGYEGETAQLSWTINPINNRGTATTVTITQDSTTVYTTTVNGTSVSNGTTNVVLPMVGGNIAQGVTYLLTATDAGTNGSGVSATSTVSITVAPNVPTATAQSGLATVSPNALPITLAGTDPGNVALTFALVTPPVHGTLSGGSGAARTYTPAASYAGMDSFTFKANNGVHDSLPALVSLAVVTTSAPPTAIGLSSTQFASGLPAGAYLGDFSSTEPNVGLSHVYTLVTGTGSTDNAKFAVVGRQLRLAQAALPAGSYAIRVRSTNALGQSLESAFTLTAAAPPAGGVVINELLYNGQNNVVHDDFVELFNNAPTAVDLSGWSLQDGVTFTFPAGTTLAAGAYLVVAADVAALHALYPTLTPLGPYAGSLSSEGETLTLRNAAGVTVCKVDYTPRFPWPLAANGEGASMELLNPNLDPSLGGNWRASIYPALTSPTDVATPGARNAQSLASPATAAPAVRQVSAAPVQPTENVPAVITARVSDPDGVASVALQYQVVAPGAFLPATLPGAITGGPNGVIAGADGPLAANPAFEAQANWISLPMNDAGVNGDAQDGDGLYSVTLPGQANRTLVRYRLVVTDNAGNAARTPYADDLARNFAYFVYNGVPAYGATPAATLTQLPTYHFLTRKADYERCVAYDDASKLRGNTASWTYENWEAALVYDGVVYDHVLYRLHGANGRYYFSGKRAFKWFFNKGYELAARDNDGALYPQPWRHVVTENLWENRGTLTYSLNEALNFYLFRAVGVPAPWATMVNFRLLDYAPEQADAYHGDYWGLLMVHEDFEKNFFDAHNLDKGNLYKLTRDDVTGVSQQRYQGPDAVSDGSDHDAIYNGVGATRLTGASTPAYVSSHVNLVKYDYYHALSEAIRHYDYWPSGDNNGAYYFDPTTYTADNDFHGQLWLLPSDTDATWGPTWNAGHDAVHNALFNDAGDAGGDSGTNPTLWAGYFNAIRDVRDVLWQPDQINPLVDQYAAVIAAQQAADDLRWKGAPADAGNYNGLTGAGMTSIAALVSDLKKFAFTGGSWPGGDVGTGGRGAFLDTLGRGVQNGSVYSEDTLPATPSLTYVGAATHPVNDLRFTTSAYAGTNPFAAVQWRLGEVTDTAAPAYVAGQKALLEWNATYDSGEVSVVPTGPFRFPAYGAKAGHTYRARVRFRDQAGRWSHWSAPAQFTAVAADVSGYQNSLVISEFLYYPAPVTAAEAAAGFTLDDFQYLEVTNVTATPVDLTDVRVTKGVNFDFASGAALAAGGRTLVVANAAAFNFRYGAGKPIAGTFASGSLAHKGEEVKLSYGAGQAIIDFTYTNAVPWPVVGTAGYSLVLRNPQSLPDPTNPANWRASYGIGGNPAGPDGQTYAWWAQAYPGAANNPTASLSNNGLSNLLVYALGGNPTLANNQGLLPQASLQSLGVNGQTGVYLTLSFRRQPDAQDLTYHPEFTSAAGLATGTGAGWTESGTLVGTAPNPDGTLTQTWRAPNPTDPAANPNAFARLRVSSP